MSQRFLERWLAAIGVLFMAIGVLMAVANDTDLFRMVFGPLIDTAFWDSGVAPEAQRFQAWVYGAWGGTVAGLGCLVAVIARPAISGGNKLLRIGALVALTLWFVVDTGASLAFGVWGNAIVVNLPAYVAMAVPLAVAGRFPATQAQ